MVKYSQHMSPMNHIHLNLITDAVGVSLYVNSLQTFPFFLGGPRCSGSEDHLIDCPLSEIKNITSCDDVCGVFCSGTKCDYTKC